VDDLALLVELVSSGWRGVDARLERLERAQGREPARRTAIVEDLPTPEVETETQVGAEAVEHAAAA
jgi:hypothetical protein